MPTSPAVAPRPIDSSAVRAARMMAGLEWLMIPVVVALGFLLASFSVRNSDFWMHLATGRLIAEGNYKFGEDPFTYTNEGRTWVNHAWLYDYLVYRAYLLDPDHSAVVYIKAGLIALLAVIMFLTCRPDPDRVIPLGSGANPRGWIAAVLIGVALVAIAPRLLLQPMISSFVLLAITFWALHQSRYWSTWALPAVIGPLFVLWVNLDNWFLLGPAFVVIFLVGEAVHGLIQRKSDSKRLKQLAITLGVGLAACLINPHHIMAFSVLPAEIKPNVVPAMMKDASYRSQFFSPLDVGYYNSPELGKSPPGFCYFSLLIAGIASFATALAFNLRAIRPTLLLSWIAMAALGLINWRLIPFFCVVGAPIVVLTIHDLFVARRSTAPMDESEFLQGTELTPATPAPTSADSSAEAWWPGATDGGQTSTTLQETSIPANRSSTMNVSPDTMLSLLVVMGRLLTIVGGLAAIAAAYPGWLHAKPANPISVRRMAWDIAPDPAFVQAAERLGQWRREGKLAADVRGVSMNLELSNYCAWFAPEIRSFMDFRFPFLGRLSSDYMVLRRGLAEWSSGVAAPEDWAEVLRRYEISYVIVTAGGVPGGEQLLGNMVLNETQWSMWWPNGRVVIFGWNDPTKKSRPDPLRLDLVALAFGSKVERIAPGETYNAQRVPPPIKTQEPDFWERYLSPPPLPTPPATDTAELFWLMRDSAYRRALEETYPWMLAVLHAGQVGAQANPKLLLSCGLAPIPPIPNQMRMAIAQGMAQAHPIPVSISLLAVREARRGVLTRPNDAFPHLMLGIAYSTLYPVGGQLRPLQHLTSFYQAFSRMNADEFKGPSGQMVTMGYLTLYEYHIKNGERDLAEEALTQAVKRYDQYPPLNTPEQHRESQKAELQKRLDGLRNDLLAVRDQYQIGLNEMRQRNRTLTEQVTVAYRFGLIREAIKLLEDARDERKLQDENLLQMIQFYLAVGRVEEAQYVYESISEADRRAFPRVRVNLLIGLGEYAAAGRAIEEIIATVEASENPNAQFVNAAKVFQQLHFSTAEMAAQSMRLSSTILGLNGYEYIVQQMAGMKAQKAELLAMRGMLALEEGDIPNAKKYLKLASDVQVRFQNDVYVHVYLSILNRVENK